MRERVITSDRIKGLAEKLDGYLDFKELVKGIAGIGLELADEVVFRIVLNLLNTKLLVKLPEELDGKVNDFVDQIINEDYQAAGDLLGDIVADLINTPIGDETENEILDAIFMFLADFINKNGGDTAKVREEVGIRKKISIKRLTKEE